MRTSTNNSPARTVLATMGFPAAAAFVLATAHRVHAPGLLP